jgi:hypothetical protein
VEVSIPDSNESDTQMSAHRKDRHPDLVPMLVAGLIAVVGSVVIFWMDFGPGADAPGGGDGMITSSVLSRSGAISSPTEPPAHLAVPKTVPVSETLTP